jgi:bifunctional non-homologous end joining protein LigD
MPHEAFLDAYRSKRRPGRTPEPFGGRRRAGPPIFVVQQHAARRLHYDLRLEMEGVLKSWAVPKGPSQRAEEKRLAVHVEDHPLEYADFEGVIPPDNYGAGAVIVWDRGRYRTFKDDPLEEQYARGKLELEFFGYKMRGRWTLVRMAKSERDWLLLKKADAPVADDDLTTRYPRSVLSGLTVEQIRNVEAFRAEVRARLADLGAPRREVSARGQGFMLATPRDRAFSSPDWLFEIKYDGVRVMADRSVGAVTLHGRSGRPLTAQFPEIARALLALPADRFVLDGEIIAIGDEGRPSFERLQARIALTAPRDIEEAQTAVPVTAVFFDCLALEGYDLRDLPLTQRKERLRLLLPPVGPVSFGDHVLEQGEAACEAACEQRLEGIVGKKVSSSYVAGRSADWVKVKCQRRQEFVIGGYTDPRGSRARFGALHLGLYEDSRLIYVSKVGSGFDDGSLERIWREIQPLGRATSPFDVGSPKGRRHHWVEPRLVCEVRFAEWTAEGGLRHPTFIALRADRRPQDCRREAPAGRPTESPRRRAEGPRPEPPREHRITNPDKVFWPEEGYTKADLVAYYETVAPYLLPYLRDRPLVLTRYPDGIAGKSFFQKDAPEFVPAWVRTERIYSTDAGRDINYFILNDVETLRYVANLATIPLHLWSSRLGALDRPDWLVLDLDPKGASFTDVVSVARALHTILDAVEVPHYPKTSGSTGLHILVPLGAAYTYEEARMFARLIGMLAVEAVPDVATLARPLRSRRGKVYVDYAQNGQGRTVVAPFSVRPLPGAPVSCPLRWDEVGPRLDPAALTIKTVPRRFARRPDPLAPVLRGSVDLLAAVEGLGALHLARRTERTAGRARRRSRSTNR